MTAATRLDPFVGPAVRLAGEAAAGYVGGVTPGDVGLLYERFGYAIFRRCLRVVGDRAMAEDVLQDVFVRVLRYGGGFRGASVLAWLQRIADRVCLDRLERERARAPRQRAGEDTRAAEGTGSPAASEASRFLAELLAALPRALREIAILHYVDERGHEEIARALGCSTMTVKRRLRALHEAARQLAGAPVDGAEEADDEALES